MTSVFAPPLRAAGTEAILRLAELVSKAGSSTVILTGAGVSTQSGIPDYRGPNGSYAKGHTPMMHQEFVSSGAARRRYWARSLGGFKAFARARASQAHSALAELAQLGYCGSPASLITQNVDGLHQQAGSDNVVELHGTMHRVKCMACGAYHCRHEFQETLEAVNKDWLTEYGFGFKPHAHSRMNDTDAAEADSLHEVAPGHGPGTGGRTRASAHLRTRVLPDGDAELRLVAAPGTSLDAAAEEAYRSFYVPPCPSCGAVGSSGTETEGVSMLKPDVVFFGDSVPADIVDTCYASVERAKLLLVVGSSLQVFSAMRFVKRAVQNDTPVAIINVGPTRADDVADFRMQEHCGAALSQLTDVLRQRAPAQAFRAAQLQ